jgi:cation:H+ antiporter
MMLLATAAFFALAADQFLDHAQQDLLTRGNGVVLLLLFCVFLYYTISRVVLTRRKTQQTDPFLEEIEATVDRRKQFSTPASLALTIVGLVALIAGGRLTVYSAIKIAGSLGIPEFIIGLTVISFGTTLPELVTGILATRRGEGDIAIGNVVGSNIFNLLFIGGIVSTISPISIPARGLLDLTLLTILSALVLPISIRGRRTITRAEGIFLLILYFSYLAWRILTST